MYTEHAVFRGLRDMSGNGVVTGLTEIFTIKAKEKAPDGSVHTCPGELYYRGYNICDLAGGFSSENRFGFEEIIYLLLFSSLPNKKNLQQFEKMLAEFRSLPKSFVRDMIMKAPGRDVMNILSRCVLALYTYDYDPDNISTKNVLRQCLHLIAAFPMLAVYSYQSYQHFHCGQSLVIHRPEKRLSTAENTLRMLDLPCELYTPIFAMARIAGWSAHRLEKLQNAGKIIRPAYIGVKPVQEYVPIENR